MAIVSEVTSEFDGTNGVQLTDVNSIFTNFIGTAYTGGALMPKYDTAVKQSGTASMRVDTSVTAGTLFSSIAFPVRDILWHDFYFRCDTAPAAQTAIWRWFAGATLIGDLRCNPVTGGFLLQLRDGQVEAYATPTLTTGQWYRIAILIHPTFNVAGAQGRMRFIVYSGVNLDTMTATYDSGNLISDAVLTACDNLKIGMATSAAINYHLDALITNDATQPQHAPGTTDIPALTENFESGTAGTSILPGSFVTSLITGSPSPSAVYFADPYAGSLGCRFNLGAAVSGGYRVQFSPESSMWQKLRFKPVAAPTTSLAIMSFWSIVGGTLTKIMDLQLMTDLTLRARDVNTARTPAGTPPALTANQYCEIGLWVSPFQGLMRWRVYNGSARGTATASFDSGLLQMDLATAFDVSEMRFGVLSADTVDYRFDRFAADRASEPPGVAPPASTLALTVNDLANVEPFAGFTLTANPTGGAPPYTYNPVQTGGVTTPLTPAGSGTASVRTGVGPPVQAGTTLTYLWTVTDSVSATATDTSTVAVLPQNLFALSSGVWTPTDLKAWDGTGWVDANTP